MTAFAVLLDGEINRDKVQQQAKLDGAMILIVTGDKKSILLFTDHLLEDLVIKNLISRWQVYSASLNGK